MRLCGILFLLLFSFSVYGAELRFGKSVIYNVDVAKTVDEQEKGLMFVRSLPENQGMLFDMRGFKNVSMWMKNTYISLDMLFLDCNFRVVDIYANAEPLSLKHITSNENFCYVLEINGGKSKADHIRIGDKAFFSE